MTARRSLSVRNRIRAGLLLAAVARAAGAETIAAGTVIDMPTESPVAGARVSIRRGQSLLGQTVSDASGIFRLPFTVATSAPSQTFTLSVEHQDYTSAAVSVVVTSGRADRAGYPISLFPRSLSPCRRSHDHAVVVGHFRPPVSGPTLYSDLAAQVADTLRYGLLTEIQQQHLPQTSQPLIIACNEARPRAPEDAPGYAKALGADAFLSGFVSPAGARFKVEMTVGNRYDTTGPPVRSSSRDVDLNDPAGARLDSRAYEAVLGALVAGYEKGNPAECVEVIAAAERILQPLPTALSEARIRCQQRLPNRGLLRDGSP